MKSKLLLIMNPVAGTRRANKFLTEMLVDISNANYEYNIQVTTPTRDAETIACEMAGDCDIVVCIGGDGTLNATVAGCMQHSKVPCIGYIPAGSANDFASGLGLSLNPRIALDNILNGEEHTMDVGMFNGKPFVYTASLGIFTKTAYNTPRELRQNLGYLAYVLAGAKELSDIKSYHLKIKSDDRMMDGDYIFGGMCNAKRVGGGVIKFTDEMVDLNDGLMEVILVKTPQNPADFMQLIFDLNAGNYNSKFIELFSTSTLKIVSDENLDWTLDGEYQPCKKKTNIEVLPATLKIKY